MRSCMRGGIIRYSPPQVQDPRRGRPRQPGRGVLVPGRDRLHAAERRPSKRDAKLAQKLGRLQPFIAVLPQECMANLHLLGQPDTLLAPVVLQRARGGARARGAPPHVRAVGRLEHRPHRRHRSLPERLRARGAGGQPRRRSRCHAPACI